MNTAQPTDGDVIDTVEVIVDGVSVFVPAEEVAEGTPVVTTPDGGMHLICDAGEEKVVSQLPSERFAAAGRKPTSTELAQIIESIRAAEQGQSHLPVLATPDGQLRLKESSGGERLVAQLPDERFAATLAAETSAVQALDPQGLHWKYAKTGAISGWFITLRNYFDDEYVFFSESQPSGLYEAQLVEPNWDHLVGHTNHMLINGRICLNQALGCRSLTDLHGALSKWILYSGLLRRGLPAPYSE